MSSYDGAAAADLRNTLMEDLHAGSTSASLPVATESDYAALVARDGFRVSKSTR